MVSTGVQPCVSENRPWTDAHESAVRLHRVPADCPTDGEGERKTARNAGDCEAGCGVAGDVPSLDGSGIRTERHEPLAGKDFREREVTNKR